MHNDKKTPARQTITHDRAWVRMLSAGVLLCSLCGTAPVAAAGPRPGLAATLVTNGKSPAAASEPQPAGRLARELWSSRVTAPDPNEDAATRLALKRLIRQIHSVRFGNEAPQPAAAPPAEPPAPSGSPKTEPAPVPQRKPVVVMSAAPTLVEPGPPPAPQQQKTAAGLLPDPSRTNDPLEIAELLFLSGRVVDAAPFYAKALEHLSAGEATTAADRAWTLFQLANCLRETSLGEAQSTYTKLISEFPDSPWTELARAQNQLVSWYQKDQPQQLAASRRP
jgi:hypothetical protein